MQRYFIHFSYDGTDFHGWQIQPNGISVQETLNNSLTTILRTDISVVGAGRTDTGVHAREMTAHFDYEDNNLDCQQVCYRLNRILPKTISVQKMEPVSDDMHARFSAKWRTYHYYVHLNKDPFLRHYSLETHYELDFDLMNKAGEILTQHKDFAAFCKAGADCKTTLCDLKECRWIKTEEGAWYMTVTANRFLRNMVRAIVGTMFLVGRKKISLDDFKLILESENRSEAGESMPGNALFLWKIEY